MTALLIFLLAGLQLPTELPQVRFNSGQDIVPYFEGWIRNPDGSFDLVFGYFNRNWKEELAIPPGPDNKVDLGGPDAGQPTYFLPRRQRWIFRMRVPKDFGNKEVAWSIRANGRTETAYGNLLPAQEINDRVVMSDGNLDPGQDDPNEPPVITLNPVNSARIATPVILAASVRDDGLPKPRPVPAPRPATPGGFGAQVDRPAATGPKGLNVTWLQYGGPAKVIFEKTGPIALTNGEAVTTARFPQPGVYHLRAIAGDGALSSTTDIVITVSP